MGPSHGAAKKIKREKFKNFKSFFGAYSTQVNTLNMEMAQCRAVLLCIFGGFVVIIESDSIGDFGPAVCACQDLIDPIALFSIIGKRKIITPDYCAMTAVETFVHASAPFPSFQSSQGSSIT